MQTGLVIKSTQHHRRELGAARPVVRLLTCLRTWATSYELASDDRIRRFTGAR